MKDYFKRLKDHPGVSFGVIFTVMIFCAALSNKSIHKIEDAIIFGSIVSIVFPWGFILISNFKK
jgi:hypothetical protein